MSNWGISQPYYVINQYHVADSGRYTEYDNDDIAVDDYGEGSFAADILQYSVDEEDLGDDDGTAPFDPVEVELGSSSPKSDSDVSSGADRPGGGQPPSTEGGLKEAPRLGRVPVLDLFRYATMMDRVILVMGAIAAFACGGISPLFMYIYGELASTMTTGTREPWKVANQFAVLSVGVGGAMLVFHTLQSVCWLTTAARQIGRMRAHFLDSVMRQDMAWHDVHKPGELTARMAGDASIVQNGINDRLAMGVMSLGMFIIGFVLAFNASWQISLLITGVLPVYLVLFIGVLLAMSKLLASAREQYAVAGSIATEVMDNIKTVQVFGREEHEVARFADAIAKARKKNMKKEFILSFMSGGIMLVLFSSFTGAFFFAAFLVDRGYAQVGNIGSAFLALFYGVIGVAALVPSASAFTDSRTAAFELFRTIDRVPAIDIYATGAQERVVAFTHSIEFDNVGFAYPSRPTHPVFTGMTFSIRKGEKVAFSGSSGCGKSTVIALLQRFYDPTLGSIRVDGTDLRHVSVTSWRDHIGIVAQEPNLFSGTILENVRMGKLDATVEEVVEACRRANIHDTILTLPQQYDTPIGAVGSHLSGGQKQRLAIARAIIRRPSLLLLDEATSALDWRSEMVVQRALDRLIAEEDITVVVVAHRMSTIRHMDRILFLQADPVWGSTVCETGTYEELLQMNGQFAAMAMMQNTDQHTNLMSVVGESSMYLLQYVDTPDDGGDAAWSAPAWGPDAYDASLGGQRDVRSAIGVADGAAVAPEEVVAEEERRTYASLMRVMKLALRDWWGTLLALVGTVCGAILMPCMAIIYGKLVTVFGEFAVTRDTPALYAGTARWAPLYIGLGVLGFLSTLLQGFYSFVGERLTEKLRVRTFAQILRQDQTFFTTVHRDPGSLAGILSGSCESVHQLWGPALGSRVRMVVTIGAGFVIGVLFLWKVALMAAATLPFIVLGPALEQYILVDWGATGRRSAPDNVIASEVFSNIRTVASFNLSEHFTDRYCRVIHAEVRRCTRRMLVVSVIGGVCQFAFFAAFALCIWYGGTLIEKGEATFEQVLIATSAVMMGALSASSDMSSFSTKLADARRAARKVFCLIDRVPDVDLHQRGDVDVCPAEYGSGIDIDFDDVTFTYPARPQAPVLRGTSLHLADGTTNGLMGQTGCGKSTIIQLLARFYHVDGGAIWVNGKDLRDLDIVTWRQHLSIVLQEPDLFSGTVRDNIRYAQPEATDEEVEEVARLAHIHDEILKMPAGYDTDVGYRGRGLSGGQKQRVAIARGLLRRPKLLLLDEATSALDNVTERKVHKALTQYQRQHGMTMVSIAHRLTTIRDCDQIVLLDTGKIIERGSHAQLMAYNGEYRVRWQLTQT